MTGEDAGSYVQGRTDVVNLAALLQRAPDNLRREIRKELRAAATPLVADVKRRAGWSRRIPGAVYTRITFTGKRAGLRIGVDADKAPHARPYEGITARARDSRRTGFRHPVYAEGGYRAQWAWVTTPFRPFLAPAVDVQREQIVSRLFAAADGVLTRRGY